MEVAIRKKEEDEGDEDTEVAGLPGWLGRWRRRGQEKVAPLRHRLSLVLKMAGPCCDLRLKMALHIDVVCLWKLRTRRVF